MPTLTLDKLVVSEVEVEIPERCPACDNRLYVTGDEEKTEGIKLDTYDAYTYYADMALCADGTLDWSYYDDKGAEGGYKTGVRCGQCGHVIATTEAS